MDLFYAFVSSHLLLFFLLVLPVAFAIIGSVFYFNNSMAGKITSNKNKVFIINGNDNGNNEDEDDEGQI
jgi:hypothetical protein